MAEVSPTGTITQLLRRMNDGDSSAQNLLFDLVQTDLRRIAQSMIRDGQWPRNGVNGTELVNMACMRLLAAEKLVAEDRRHFFFILGRAMHDVLVDEARKATSAKRGGGWNQSPLVDFSLDGGTTSFDMLELRHALDKLAAVDSNLAMVVSLRFFSGRSLRDTADILNRTLAQVRGDWDYARAWLADEMDIEEND